MDRLVQAQSGIGWREWDCRDSKQAQNSQRQIELCTYRGEEQQRPRVDDRQSPGQNCPLLGLGSRSEMPSRQNQ